MRQGWNGCGRLAGAALAAALVAACGGGGGGGRTSLTSPGGGTSPGGTGGAPTSRAPTALFSGGPIAGVAPLVVTLDASPSTDPDEPTTNLMVRWDFDGDGAWDSPLSAQKSVTHTYAAAGRYVVRLEVRDSTGLTAVGVSGAAVDVSAPAPAAAVADLGVDTNRDGLVTAADEAGEDAFSATGGAAFLANLDDDDADGIRDASDSILSGAADRADLAPVVVRRSSALVATDTVRLTLSPAAAAARTRVFRLPAGGGGTVVHAAGASSALLSASELAAGDLTLGIEATETRSSSWDGRVTLRLEVVRGGTVLSSDQVAMRVAPVVFTDNTRAPQRLFVLRITNPLDAPNAPFYSALTQGLPTSVPLSTLSETTYNGDRWVQDHIEPGYQAIPGAQGAVVLPTHLKTERSGDLADHFDNELLGPGRGYVYPGGQETSLNYGGNIEVLPTHTGYPLGRLVVGGGSAGMVNGQAYTDRMTPTQRAFLDAQGLQGPCLEVSSEWLAVGHVDEIFLFVPNPGGSGKPFRVVIASPALARTLLVDAQSRGFGSARAFSGRTSERTVSSILADSALQTFNQQVQARIDTVRTSLAQAMGLTTADFVEVPVLYAVERYGGLNFAAAYNPGIQNLVPVGARLFVPDPEGPSDASGDVWERATRNALTPLGFTVTFVDVFESYHELLGEAHCGTTVERAAYASPWWQY